MGNLREVGSDRTDAKPLFGRALQSPAIPMKHGPAGIVRGRVVTVEIETHEIVAFQIALPQK